MATNSFFYGGATGPTPDSTQELLDAIQAKLEEATALTEGVDEDADRAEVAATAAEASRDEVAVLAGTAQEALADAQAALETVTDLAAGLDAAVTTAIASASDATAAAVTASAAAESASTNAGTANAAALLAGTSATDAAANATSAGSSATNASNSAGSASASAGTAASAATNASISATAAAGSATAASGFATAAGTSASGASIAAAAAASSASAASGSASSASTSAAAASGSASLASTSATNAAQSAVDALAAANSGVRSFNTRRGDVALSSGDVTGALTFTPYNATNPLGFITGSGSTSGNAGTATKLATARSINGVSFDGTANITITAAASGGNAATATALQTARSINGVSFDGTGNITVTDSTKLPLTGGSLSGGLGIATTDQHLVATESGTSAVWRGRILSKNAAADRALMLGTLGTRSLIASHNNALSAWAPLFINFDGDSGSGGVYFGPSGTTHNGTAQFVGNNAALFGPNITYGGKLTIGGSSLPIAGESVTAGIYVSNGNLHLEAGVSHPIYLGYSQGNGVVFGTGATGPAAYMSTVGQLYKGTGDTSGDKYATVGQTNDWTNQNHFVSNRGSSVSLLSSDSAALQAYSGDSGPAFMSFHRGGAYAVNFGLDNDNVMKIGGWSAGTTARWTLDMATGNMGVLGNFAAAGSISALTVFASRIYAGFDPGVSGSISCSNWFRTSGATGIYFSDYATGLGPISLFAGSNYGSVATYGSTSGWSGYSINGGLVFMHDNNSNGTWGIYDDYRNQWLMSSDFGGNTVFQGNVTAYSDKRLKKDITRIKGSLGKLLELTGVTFTRIDTEQRGIGVIAQDVLKVFPEAVTEAKRSPEDADPILTVAYGNLVGPIIEALRELAARVEALEACR